jgi:hypothetical protein
MISWLLLDVSSPAHDSFGFLDFQINFISLHRLRNMEVDVVSAIGQISSRHTFHLKLILLKLELKKIHFKKENTNLIFVIKLISECRGRDRQKWRKSNSRITRMLWYPRSSSLRVLCMRKPSNTGNRSGSAGWKTTFPSHPHMTIHESLQAFESDLRCNLYERTKWRFSFLFI